MSTERPRPTDHPAADQFADAYTSLIDDLASTLYLTAGAADATHPATYSALATDLSEVLDVDTGLAAIIGSSSSAEPQSIGSEPPLVTSAAQAHRFTAPRGTLTAAERLSLRARPAYRHMRLALQIAQGFNRDHDLALALASALTRDPARARARAVALARDLARASDFSPGRVLFLIPDELDRAHELARELNRNLNLNVGRIIDRESNFDLTAIHERRLTGNHHNHDLAIAIAHDLAIARDHALGIARALALDIDVDSALAPHLDLNRTLDLAKSEKDDHDATRMDKTLAGVLTRLSDVGDNFVGADLRAATLPALQDMDGIQWSATTSWPSEGEDRVRAASAEIEPGIFQITGDDRQHTLTEVST